MNVGSHPALVQWHREPRVISPKPSSFCTNCPRTDTAIAGVSAPLAPLPTDSGAPPSTFPLTISRGTVVRWDPAGLTHGHHLTLREDCGGVIPVHAAASVQIGSMEFSRLSSTVRSGIATHHCGALPAILFPGRARAASSRRMRPKSHVETNFDRAKIFPALHLTQKPSVKITLRLHAEWCHSLQSRRSAPASTMRIAPCVSEILFIVIHECTGNHSTGTHDAT
jgi:hypothetical protein